MSDCVFCKIVAGDAPAEIVGQWPETIAIRPLNPVVPGHTLVLPTTHVRDAGEDPDVTATTMRRVARLSRVILPADFNIITSAGPAATQTVFHLHVHLVPRVPGDGLALPWTGQHQPRIPDRGDPRRAARAADPHAHACVTCSPDGVLTGPGCINCRQTGMDQTPCTALGHTRSCPHGCCGGPRTANSAPNPGEAS
jgi:histidine triad (HIT) family protein